MWIKWDNLKKILFLTDDDAIHPIGGSGQIKETSIKTADYSLTVSDYSIAVNAVANTVDIEYPASPESGREYNVACIDSTYAVTLDFNGKTLAGDSTLQIYEGENLTLQFNGTEWIGA